MFGWLFGGKSSADTKSAAPGLWLMESGGHYHRVVGESYYQHVLERIAGKKDKDSVELEVVAVLRPEPSPYDSNAVAVQIAGEKVGSLAGPDAREMGAFLDREGASAAKCQGVIVGGWKRPDGDEGSFGVQLDIRWPPRRE